LKVHLNSNISWWRFREIQICGTGLDAFGTLLWDSLVLSCHKQKSVYMYLVNLFNFVLLRAFHFTINALVRVYYYLLCKKTSRLLESCHKGTNSPCAVSILFAFSLLCIFGSTDWCIIILLCLFRKENEFSLKKKGKRSSFIVFWVSKSMWKKTPMHSIYLVSYPYYY
jgi:hypothetical protein